MCILLTIQGWSGIYDTEHENYQETKFIEMRNFIISATNAHVKELGSKVY